MHIEDELVPEVELDCPEPGCGGKLRRRFSERTGKYFYGCARYSETGCRGAVGCHADGSPLGIPGDATVRQARRRAHAVFDRLWKPRPMGRREAYKLASMWMGIPFQDMHIGNLDAEQCEQLVRATQAYLGASDIPPGCENCPWTRRNPVQLSERLKAIDQRIDALEKQLNSGRDDSD